MKTILCSLVWIAITGSCGMADGYPFEPTSQEVLTDSLRVRLTRDQVETLSSNGTVTFSEAQLLLIRAFYPRAHARQGVIAATFNDNHEGLSGHDVYVFWTAAEEVAITLNPKVLSEPNLKRAALAAAGHPRVSDIRLAPDGRIFIEGKASSLKDALALIERRSEETGSEDRQVNVCVAPAYRSSTRSGMDEAVEQVFAALADHGAKRSVVVSKCWWHAGDPKLHRIRNAAPLWVSVLAAAVGQIDVPQKMKVLLDSRVVATIAMVDCGARSNNYDRCLFILQQSPCLRAGRWGVDSSLTNMNPLEKPFGIVRSDIRQLIVPMGGCLATDRIVVNGQPVGFMYREAPTESVRSGWTFLAGDEDEEYLDNPDHWAIYEVNTICNYDPTIIPYLDSPVGAAWGRDLGAVHFQQEPMPCERG